MKKFNLICVLAALLLVLCACTPAIPQSGVDPFDFKGNATNPEVILDGVDDDELWQGDNVIKVSFGTAEVSIVRRPTAVYFFYKVRDLTPYRFVKTGAAEEVTKSDSVEFYFDAKLTRTSAPTAYDFQVNLGRDGRTRICTGSGWVKWMALYMFEVREGVDDEEAYYFVEAMLPVEQMGVGATEAMGIAFGQVDRMFDVDNDMSAYYSWTGLTVNGQFVDPQVPSTYLVLTPDGDRLYTYEEYIASVS